MTVSKPRKIVYLFGAGATHAELANLQRGVSVKFEDKRGLLIKHVSNRVFKQARLNKSYLKNIEMVSNVTGLMNIELLISLIENSRIKHSTAKTLYLKKLVKNDISTILTKDRLKRFYLHRALLELHKQQRVKEQEDLIGLITLNYDAVLDEAYKNIHNIRPNYSFVNTQVEGIPLLKLHGSFNWNNFTFRGKRRSIEIIPLGSSKHYLHIPYNFIWSRALELLIECDVLRVVGCSLSQNDIHLIDLLFKAHLERGGPFEIQVIDWDQQGENIQKSYGFFPLIKRLTQIEPPLISEPKPENPFKYWLASKCRMMMKEDVNRTKYLKKVIS